MRKWIPHISCCEDLLTKFYVPPEIIFRDSCKVNKQLLSDDTDPPDMQSPHQ